MKKLLLFLLFTSFTAYAAEALESLESFDEWQPDPHLDLSSLLQETYKMLSQEKTPEVNKAFQEIWYKTLELVSATPQDYEDIFKRSYIENFKKCGIKPQAPLHVCLGLDRPEQITPQALKEIFDVLTNAQQDHAFIEHATRVYIGLYNKNFLENPNKESFLYNINSKNPYEFAQAADIITKIARQCNYLRTPMNLEFAKALAHSWEALSKKIKEYQQAAQDLHITREFAQQVHDAFIMRGAGGIPEDLDQVLENPAFTLPEEPSSRSYQWYRRFSPWFLRSIDDREQEE